MRKLDEVDAWIDQHEKEHGALEERIVGRARDEMVDVADGVKAHVDKAVGPVVEHLKENATYRADRAAREQLALEAKQKLAARKTKAEIELAVAKRRATWVRLAIALAAFIGGVLLKEGCKP